jgi:hypothetical protein
MRRFTLVWSLFLSLSPAALHAQEPGYPQYCCTDVGRFGPFGNGTVNVGERCSAVDTAGVRHVGAACHGRAGPPMFGPMETTGYADRCCTDVGVLGPFRDASWREGDSCAAVTEDGTRHEGVACYGVGALLGRTARGEQLLAAAHRTSCGGDSVTAIRLAATPASPAAARRTGSR